MTDVKRVLRGMADFLRRKHAEEAKEAPVDACPWCLGKGYNVVWVQPWGEEVRQTCACQDHFP